MVEPNPAPETEGDYLYHVTTYRRLETIAEHGLLRGRSRAIGASSLDTHADKGIFLTEGGGVYFWHARAEDHANAGSDDLLEDGVIPVVLRIPDDVAAIPDVDELDEDDVGTENAGADAWASNGPIKPADIEVYDGKAWVPVALWETIDVMRALEPVDQDDDGNPIYDFVDDSPLLPPELRS